MQAIILAGGFGTRLRSVVADVPKVMAPIGGKPFLAHLMDYLKTQGITDVVLSVHYLREQIAEYFKDSYRDISIQYAVEEQPLGTGGAVVNSLRFIDVAHPVFVLNGDTFLKINYRAMLAAHLEDLSSLTIALRKIPDCSRYGVVTVENERVTGFRDLGDAEPGLINAGVYLLREDLFRGKNVAQQFSFERDFLFPQIAELMPRAFLVEDYFIDIGVPEDYTRAYEELSASTQLADL